VRSKDWDREADVVVVGSGATGLPAAIVAREAGASVIVVEAENHIGGHAITSGGNLPLGGGTSYQKKYGIEDSPDLLFRDLTDWSLVEPNGFPPYRYNDREIVRAFADNSAAAFEFLLAHGVKVVEQAPDNASGHEMGISALRTMHCAVMDWPMIQTGKPADPSVQATLSSGNGLMQPLYAAALEAGVEMLLEHRMTAIHRETPASSRVNCFSISSTIRCCSAIGATGSGCLRSTSPEMALNVEPVLNAAKFCAVNLSPYSTYLERLPPCGRIAASPRPMHAVVAQRLVGPTGARIEIRMSSG